MKNLFKLINEKNNKIKKLEKLEEEFSSAKNNLLDEINELKKLIYVENNNLDSEIIKKAETMIYVDGYEKYYGKGETYTTFHKAINAIAAGGKGNNYLSLFEGYYGCKNYDRWTCQGVDCEYGYGPRHGSVVFSIGLKQDYREGKKVIPENDRNIMIYYLSNLGKIKEGDK